MTIRLNQRAPSNPPPVFSVQPIINPSSGSIGTTFSLSTGTASDTNTYTVNTFTVDGVDKSGELTGTGPWSWDSTGETAGAIVYQVTATGSGGSTNSSVINGTLSSGPVPTWIEDPSIRHENIEQGSIMTFNKGLATDTLSHDVVTFTVGGVDKTSELVDRDTVWSWNSTGLGAVVFQSRAVGASATLDGPILSGKIGANNSASWKIQPTIRPTTGPVGTTFTIYAGAAENFDSFTVKTFTVNGVDRKAQLTDTGNGAGPWTWDSTGETELGEMVFVLTADDAVESADSNSIKATLVVAGTPEFTTQPSINKEAWLVGSTIRFDKGTASGSPTYTATTLTVDDVDKSSELVDQGTYWDWDTTGETPGEIAFQVTASNGSGSDVSNRLTSQLNAVDNEFNITVIPTNPQIGEATQIIIEGAGPFETEDILRDISFVTDVDDDGTGFKYLPDEDETTAYGRVFSHTWTTKSTRTLTITAYKFGETAVTQNVNVTVIDPDTDVTWTHTYWIDATGDTTGMPADDASNTRVLSSAAFTSLPEGNISQSIRYRWRSDTTHVILPTGSPSNYRKSYKAGMIRWDTFDGTIPAEIDISTSATGSSHEFIRYSDAVDGVMIGHNLRFKGDYNPITGVFGSLVLPFAATGTYNRCRWALNKVEAEGTSQLINVGGNISDTRIALHDCAAIDFMDFGSHLSGHHESIGFRGVLFDQSELAGNHVTDGKSYDSPNWGNHGPMRFAAFQRVGVSQCQSRNTCGWTGNIGGYDQYVQAFLRLYCNALGQRAGAWACIIKNQHAGTNLLSLGKPDTNDDIQYGNKTLVDGNSIDFNHQWGQVVDALGIGGVSMMNNAIYRPALSLSRTSIGYRLLRQYNQELDASYFAVDYVSGILEDESWGMPNYVGHNTYFSDSSDSLWTHSQQGSTAFTEFLYSGEIDVPTWVAENNQFSGDGHDVSVPASIASTAFSRGDNFRPITAGAAVDTVTTATPALDINAVQRVNPTNKGAHHTHGSDVSVTAPANSVIPTISSVRTDYMQVTDMGTWTVNYLNEYHMLERRWLLDGAAAGGDQRSYSMVLETGDLSGNITCEVTLTNRSGTRTTVTTGPVAV